MGKKTKKQGNAVPTFKPFCYFCDREFEDEAVLMQHQVSKHFRCQECTASVGQVFAHGKRTAIGQCDSLHGLMCHMGKVHSKDLIKVPNAIAGRDDASSAYQIHGMNYVPQEVIEERCCKLGIAMPRPEEAPVPDLPPIPVMAMELPPLPLELSTSSFALPPLPSQSQEAPALPDQAPPAAALSPADLAAQVQEWVARKAKEDAEREAQEQAQKKADMAKAMAYAVDLGALPPTSAFPDQRIEASGFSGRRRTPSPGTQERRRNEVSNAFGSRSPDRNRPPPSRSTRPGSRSPSRGRRGSRSRSRGRPRGDNRDRGWRRSRSREGNGARDRNWGSNRDSWGGGGGGGGGGGRKPDARDMRTIHIIGGLSERTTRLWLKKQMEMFGGVEICHTGNRHSVNAEFPWVRFRTQGAAENCMNAVNNGTLVIDGTQIKATIGSMGDGSRQRPPPNIPMQRSERDMQLTSRDLALADRHRNRSYRD